jgi:hypothetical protein
MRRRFDGAPVVARREGNGINAIHDALVVRSGAIRIDAGEFIREDDAVTHFLARITLAGQILGRDHAARAHHGAVGEVGKNAQEDTAAGHRFHQRGNAFAHGVDQIGAHCVARVDQQVHHQHVAAFGASMHVHFQILRATTTGHHLRMQTVGEIEQLVLTLQQRRLGVRQMRHVDDLHLTDQNRLRALHLEAARAAHDLGGRRQRGHDRRLLDHQRHDIVASVDEEVKTQADRQTHHADDVLDHLVGFVDLQGVLA